MEEVSALAEYMGGVKQEIGTLREGMAKIYEGCDALDTECVQDVEQFNLRWRIAGWPKKITVCVEEMDSNELDNVIVRTPLESVVPPA